MDSWWRECYDRDLEEESRLKTHLRLTIYGAFQPPKKKQKLEGIVRYLQEAGYTDCDIVVGPLRPNPDNLGSYQMSIFCLEHSDANFFVLFTRAGLMGVTNEIDYVINTPHMRGHWPTSAIFSQKDRVGRRAIGDLMQDHLHEMGDSIRVIEFRTLRELREVLLIQAMRCVRIKEIELRERVSP